MIDDSYLPLLSLIGQITVMEAELEHLEEHFKEILDKPLRYTPAMRGVLLESLLGLEERVSIYIKTLRGV